MKAITSAAPLAWILLAALPLAGCHSSRSSTGETATSPATEAPAKAETAETSNEGLSLKPEEVEKMGIVTTKARAITSEPAVAGFGVILPHETIAQSVAELRTARAAAQQSQSALARSTRLAGTPGAMPAEVQESAERQATADRVAVELARQRLSSSFGQSPPWKSADSSSEVSALASGQLKLVRVTFPLGSNGNTVPTAVNLAHLGGSPAGHIWQARPVWRAPADTSIPGASYFAVVKDSEAAEGEHLLAWAPYAAPESGVLIPAAAAVLSAGKFWCYIEEKPGTFVRREFDPGRPTSDGYFVKEGFSPGQRIVTASAGQLLARETNPSTEAD